MTISWNNKDEWLSEIQRLAGLDFNTSQNYRIYGLAQNQENPLILLEYNFNRLRTNTIAQLAKFFNDNKVRTDVTNLPEDRERIYIGLRLDLRNNINFCTATVQTIIYYLEEKLKLKKKIPNVPKFEQ